MDMAETVPAAEFARNFGRYKLLAQREAVPVSSNGTLAGYFVSPHEYEELRRLKGMRRSFDTAELSDQEFEAIASARMDPRHDHLNSVEAALSHDQRIAFDGRPVEVLPEPTPQLRD